MAIMYKGQKINT